MKTPRRRFFRRAAIATLIGGLAAGFGIKAGALDPARAYMNLLELPVLFYVVCLLMLSTGRFDSVQVSLAWLFVVTRYVHAFIYIGFNHVPIRLAAFLTGFFTLAVIWTRFVQLYY
jgi:hypothetical protein